MTATCLEVDAFTAVMGTGRGNPAHVGRVGQIGLWHKLVAVTKSLNEADRRWMSEHCRYEDELIYEDEYFWFTLFNPVPEMRFTKLLRTRPVMDSTFIILTSESSISKSLG